jgi:hypothetical protein
MASKKTVAKKHGSKQVKAGTRKVRSKAARPVQKGIPESALLDVGDYFACKASVNPNRLDREVLIHREREKRADREELHRAMESWAMS